MFRNNDTGKNLLFHSSDLSQFLRSRAAALQQEVDSIDSNRLLNTAIDDLKRYLVERYCMTPICLLRDKAYADVSEVMVDVRYDPSRWIDDKSRPVLKPGEAVEIRVPFDGMVELFYARPDTRSLNPPRATVCGNEVVLRYETPADAPRDVRPLIDRSLEEIEQHLVWQRTMLDTFNNGLAALATRAIEGRRQRLLAQSERAAALGIPIRRRDNAPQTYAISTVRKKAAPTLPPASSTPFSPEPAWAMEQYEQALRIMQDMALVMERSPAAFKTMDEEMLRQHFLVQLNGQFEGKATAETFNMSGKTDILLREEERNVFIAECKFWKGQKAFGEAIDQLLSYSTWRDCKAVILLFNRSIATSTVLDGVEMAANSHSNFKRTVDWRHESSFRYVFHANGDANREIILTVLVFHVPS